MTRRAEVIAAIALWAVLALLAVTVAVAKSPAPVVEPHIVATSQPAAEVCFPAKLWSAANPEDRPCTTVRRPAEDGSGDLILGTVGADAATCAIPNPYEERGRFVIHCHRVPNR